MSNGVNIRDAREADVRAITRIYAHWVETGTMSFELTAPDDEEMARRYWSVLDAGYPYLVLEDKGDVLGYAYAGAYRPRPAYRYTAENSIYMRHDAGGRGLGRMLLNALLERLRTGGYRSVIGIISDPDRNAASVQLHRAAGFVEFGRAKEIGHKFGRWIDVAYLQLVL